MKTLLLGNEALARGLYEAGCSFVSSYPGTPSTEITESVARYDAVYAEWAPNEKVAVESAFGASLSGKRSFCGMKHVGLNVAADPLFTVSYTGVNAGMVICVADDPSAHSSQNEQDSRHYAVAAKIPMLEPSDSAEALAFAKIAYELSETFDTPVLIRMCTRVSHAQSIVETGERTESPTRPYQKNFDKYVMMPRQARERHTVVEERLRKLSDWAETAPVNRMEEGEDRRFGFVCGSSSYQYLKEVVGNRFPVLKLGMVYPVPSKLLKDFADSVEQLIVVEELDGIVEGFCRNLGIPALGKELFGNEGEFTQNRIRKALHALIPDAVAMPVSSATLPEKLPVRPPVLCPGCPHRGIFYAIHKLKLTVMGDIGCYTLGSMPPLSCNDATICMGASVSMLHGFIKAGDGRQDAKAVCVIGDSTFIHSGITGLISVAYNNSNATVIILDNSTTGMTGHQQNPTTGKNLKGDPAAKVDIETLCRAIGLKQVRVVDPYDLKACEQALREELDNPDPSAIISRRPCALLKSVKHPGPLTIDPDKCIGCKACMQLGCPCISISGGKAVIDRTLCTGCGMCAQLCAKKAMGGDRG